MSPVERRVVPGLFDFLPRDVATVSQLLVLRNIT